MAWVSPKVYAILNSSEEGKDIIEKLPDMSQDECQQELDAFFGEGGKGFSASEDYGKVKEETGYDEINEALADNEWTINDNTTVGQYVDFVANKINVPREKVMKVLSDLNGRELSDDLQMGKFASFYEEEPEGKSEDAPKEQSEWHKDLSDKSEYAQIYKEDAMKVAPERAKKVVDAIENYIKESERGVISFKQMDEYSKQLGLDELDDKELSQMWEDVHNVAGYYGYGQNDFQKSIKILDAQSAFAEVINREARKRRGQE